MPNELQREYFLYIASTFKMLETHFASNVIVAFTFAEY